MSGWAILFIVIAAVCLLSTMYTVGKLLEWRKIADEAIRELARRLAMVEKKSIDTKREMWQV